MSKILIADDEKSMRTLLSMILQKEGHQIHLAGDGKEGWELCQREKPDLVIQDLRMPLMDGLTLLQKIKTAHPLLPVIVITAFSNWETAVEAMRLGAFDYIKKPFDNDNIRAVVSRALQNHPSIPGSRENFTQQIIGSSSKLREILEGVKRIAPTDATVLIQGESGTGKELIGAAIHYNSLRATGPLLVVNCATFTESLLESELFGHCKGAFTGAIEYKKGYLELAQGGTLVLDEIGEMSLPTQVKFLRVVENREFFPLGGQKPLRVNVRFIACTNRDLLAEVHQSRFRHDLYYRLNVIPIDLPPLRERKDDIPLLVGHFLAKYSEKMKKQVHSISPEALSILRNYDWPGNVRELENIIQRSVAFSIGDTIQTIALFGGPKAEKAIEIPDDGMDLEKKLEEIEKEYIRLAMEKTRGHITKAAKLLNLEFRSMRYRLKKYKL